MTRKFDPFALDKPVVSLGEHGEFTLADVTQARLKKLTEIGDAIGAADDADPDVVVRHICDLVEAALDNADGIAFKLVADWRGERIGLVGLKGLAEFVSDWVVGQQQAGEA